ncbi:MAG TPA: O-antigen ligase family protein [Polyangia bacterium]|nr:O-antigen ligase family protein [Polyangia bacterium]
MEAATADMGGAAAAPPPAAGPAAAAASSGLWLKFLLFGQLVFTVNELQFPNPNIPGIVWANLFFVFIYFAYRSQPDTIKVEGMLKSGFLFFGASLVYGFFIAQIHSPKDVMEDLTYVKNGLFYFFFYTIYLRCRQDAKTTRQLIIWIMVIVAVAGVQGLRQGMDYGFGHYNPTHRASGPFGHGWEQANRAGVFYAMFIGMFLAQLLFLRKWIPWRLGSIGGICLLVGGIISTYSRQSYGLSLVAVTLLVVRRNILIAVALALAAGSLVQYLPESATQRVQETEQKDSHGNEEADESTASRWQIWEGGLKMFAHYPAGVGILRFHTEIGNFSEHIGRDAHNFYVLTLAETGPFGILSLLYLHFRIFMLGRWMRKQTGGVDDPELRALTIGFRVCAVNAFAGAIYGSPTLQGSVMAPFWALAGLLERYCILKTQATTAQPAAAAPAQSLSDRFPLAAYISPGGR